MLCMECGFRSQRGVEWPECTNCGDLVCEDCYISGSFYEDEGREFCLCKMCEREERQRDNEYFSDPDELPDEPVQEVDFS